MRCFHFILLFFVLSVNSLLAFNDKSQRDVSDIVSVDNTTHILYDEIGLQNCVSTELFEKAMIGYDALDIPNKDIITLIDFSKPSTEERLFVIDMKEKRILFSTYVSHGKNSGENYATSFSNKMKSNKSSLGFFITGNTYRGKRGYSLTLDGQEKGINDNARMRGVVFHGAKYVNPALISSSGGRLGRSRGCPALPMSVFRPLIDTIKGGTMVFIYANNNSYINNSPILSRK